MFPVPVRCALWDLRTPTHVISLLGKFLVHKNDKNLAKPCMILTDGTPFYIPPTELSADSRKGGSGGLRSSVNDLLKWSQCLLSARM